MKKLHIKDYILFECAGNKQCDCGCNGNPALQDELEGDEYAYALKELSNRALNISELIENEKELPSWVQDKFTSMKNDMDDVYNYLMEKIGSDDTPIEAEAGDMEYELWEVGAIQEAYNILEKWGKLEWSEKEESLQEAKYKGREVSLGKIMAGDVKKFKVYVKNDKGNVVKVNFGQKGVRIKKNDPKRRKSFRARHKCDTPGPRWKPRYWACKTW